MVVQARDELPQLDGISSVEQHNGETRLMLADGTAPQDILQALVSRNVTLEKFEIAVPRLDEIFIRVVEEGNAS